MKQEQIEQLFRDLHLRTEEQRAAMRFESLVVEHASPIQVFTTDSTCSVAESEKRELA
jgi:hypothetical protein